MKNKAFAVAAAVCAAAMMLGGCGAGNGSSSASDNIITAYNSEPQKNLIPGNINETGGGKPADLLFARLVSFDAKGNASNEIAESITPNADATQYTIKLKDWKFANGQTVKAENFTKAWSYVANAKNAMLCSSFFNTIAGYDDLQKTSGLKGNEQLSGLKVVDDKTFTVTLNQPDSVFPLKVGYTGFAPLPDSFFKDAASAKAFGQNPKDGCTGPYVFDHWDHNKEIAMLKNTDYNGNRKAQNDGVTFKVYTSDTAAYADVQAGNLDVMEAVPAAQTKTFEKDAKVQAYNKAGSVIQTFTIPSNLEHFQTNTEEGQLRRQAVSMAIDRSAITSKVLSGTGTPAFDFTSPMTPGYSKSLKGNDVLKYNKAKAKELWAKADAISKFSGKLTFSYNADGGHESIYKAIVNFINNTLGSEVAATNPMPTFNEFRDAVTNRKIAGAFRTGWQPAYPSAENYLFQIFDSKAADGNGSNDGDYKNAEFDALLAKAYATTDTDEANKLYQQSEEILLKELPAFPVYNANAYGVASKNVKSGFAMNWQNLPTYEKMSKK